MGRNAFLGLLLIALAGAATYFFVLRTEDSRTTGMEYNSGALSLSFEYPNDYVLEEHDMGTGERERHVVILTHAKDLPPPENGEGPPTMTVELFQNDLDNYTADSFVRGTDFANFKLSPNGLLEEASVAAEPALQFLWSGLYEGRSVVVARPGWVYVFSVTYMTPLDTIISDFDRLLSTVRFAASSGPMPSPSGVGIANPASEHCVGLSGTLEIIDGAGGQYSLCHLPDGRVCEEWILFRAGECVVPD